MSKVQLRNVYTGEIKEYTVEEIYEMYKESAEELGQSIKESFDEDSYFECINGMVDYDEENDRFVFTEGEL